MANLLDITPVYISGQDFRDTTTNSYLKSTATDEEIKGIIYNSQIIIDDYVVHYGCPFVEGQPFIFPVTIDGISTIPNDIAIATVYVGEDYYANSNQTTQSNIKSDKVGPRTITYFDSSEVSTTFLDSKTQTILDRYKHVFYNEIV